MDNIQAVRFEEGVERAADTELDKRLDVLAEFFLDRVLEKILYDRKKSLLQPSTERGMVKV